MYIKVNSLALLNNFNEIWMESWLEKGYGLENSASPSEQYLITDSANEKVGTIEFKQYNLDSKNNINTVFPFHEIGILNENADSVVEVDKVSILKKFRGKNLERLLSVFVYYTEFHQFEYCVALLEKNFYKALKIGYKFPMEKVCNQIYYKGDYVIPVIVYPAKIYKNKEQYSWLLNSSSKHKRGFSFN